MEGGGEVTVPAPLEQIPLFAKAGTVIPFTRSDLDTLATDLAGRKYRTLDNALIWRIFTSVGTSTSSFETYDGAKVSVEQSEERIEAKGQSPKIRQYEVVARLQESPREVLLSGERMEPLDTLDAFPGKTGWMFDPATKELHVRFLTSDFRLHINL